MLLVAAPILMAQSSSTGALQGTVTDASGSVIPGATVTLISAATSQARTATTTADGTYRFPLLNPGAYQLKFAANGFKGAEAAGIQVSVTESAEFNEKLEVGAATQEITVEANTEAIQTSTAAMGTVVGGAVAAEIPLASRNYTNLLGLSAGTNANVSNASTLGRGGMEVATNGASTSQNTFQMDGVSIVNFASTGTVTEASSFPSIGVPNPDTIAEFKIQTSSYDAGYGRNPGANVNVITKSGSNSVHGTAFEFLRNTDLNANDFFRNRSGGSKQVFNQNQFGGVIGGPIKKDKLFYFASYQQTGQKNGIASQGYQSGITLPPIPTGDRSNTAAFQAAMGAAFCPANHPGSAFLTNPGGGGSGLGTQVACDGSNINPIAIKYLQAQLPGGSGYFIPSSGTSGFLAGVNYSIPAIDQEYQGMLNLDYLLNEKNTVSVRYFHSVEPQTMPFPETGISSQLPGTPGVDPFGYINGVGKLTTIVTSNIVNEARISFQRTSTVPNEFPPASTYASNIYGLPAGQGLLSSSIPFTPDLSITGEFTAGGYSHISSIHTLQAQIGDQLSWNVGKQTIRMGGEIEQIKWDWDYLGLSHGIMAFQTFGDFLIGLPGNCGAAVAGACNGSAYSNILNTTNFSVRAGSGGIVHEYLAKNANLFVQDDIKLSQQLTVNVGVRWEYDGFMSDKYGNNTNVWLSQLATVNNPASFPTTAATGTYAGWVVPSNYSTSTYGPLPAGVLQTNSVFTTKNGVPLGDFAPRLGLAWQPIAGNNKLVIRSGAGFFYDRVGGGVLVHGPEQAPPYAETLDQGASTNQFSSEAAPFLKTPLGTFPVRWLNFANNTGSAVGTPSMIDSFVTPLVYSWNLNAQYQFAPTWVLEAGYVGSRGIDQANTTHYLNGALVASPTTPINGVTVNTSANAQLRVPYLGYSPTGIQASDNAMDYKFEGLQATLRKQLSHGLTFQASYSFSRAYATTLNNPMAPQYGLNPSYRPERLVINYNYAIPSGNRKGALGTLTNGWSISGVTTIQGGQALTLLDTRGGAVYGLGGTTSTAQIAPGYTYANLETSGSLGSRLGGASGGTGYFNGADLTTIPVVGATPGVAGTGATGWGNTGVGIVLGPGQFNFDASIVKSTRVGGIHENAVLQFRTEFFNMFNHPQFNNPALNFSAASFGTITSTSVNPRLMQFALKYVF